MLVLIGVIIAVIRGINIGVMGLWARLDDSDEADDNSAFHDWQQTHR